MPLYSYSCLSCDSDTEVLTKISERDSQWCNRCAHRLSRCVDLPGLVWSPTANGGYK